MSKNKELIYQLAHMKWNKWCLTSTYYARIEKNICLRELHFPSFICQTKWAHTWIEWYIESRTHAVSRWNRKSKRTELEEVCWIANTVVQTILRLALRNNTAMDVVVNGIACSFILPSGIDSFIYDSTDRISRDCLLAFLAVVLDGRRLIRRDKSKLDIIW